MKNKISLLITLLFLLQNTAIGTVDTNNINIIKEPISLNSKLRKSYTGYQYTITNNSKRKYTILNAQIIKGCAGDVAYSSVEKSSGEVAGTVWAIAGPVGLVTLGLGWVVGILATPIACCCVNCSDKKARIESTSYSNNIPLGYLTSNESIEVRTLVPIGATPQLKLTIQDISTKETEVISQ